MVQVKGEVYIMFLLIKKVHVGYAGLAINLTAKVIFL